MYILGFGIRMVSWLSSPDSAADSEPSGEPAVLTISSGCSMTTGVPREEVGGDVSCSSGRPLIGDLESSLRRGSGGLFSKLYSMQSNGDLDGRCCPEQDLRLF